MLVGLVLAGFLPGQGTKGPDEVPPAIADLEKQRALHRGLLEAKDAGDHLKALRLCVASSELAHVVPMPYTADGGKAALAELGRALLQQHAKLTDSALANARSRDLGKACRKCSGRAFTRCRRCSGRGYRDVRAGRRKRRIVCKAWDPCSVCEGSGRLATTPKVHDRLQRLVLLTGQQSVKKDVIAVLKYVQQNLDGVPPGLTLDSPKGQQFRQAIGPSPVNPDRLKNKSKLKSLWLNSLPEERREFLYAFALEAATVAHELSFLDELEDAPTPARVVKEAQEITLEDLEWKGPGMVGRFVTFEAIGKRVDQRFRTSVPLPFEGVIALEGLDPNLMQPFCYSAKDVEAVRIGSRLGLWGKRERSIRNYPPRLVMKQLQSIGPGKPLRLWARVLAHPDGVPTVLLEVWRVVEAGAEDGQGK